MGGPALGGMGEVYRARDLQGNGREVAYKVMRHGRHASADLVARFHREAVITHDLRQPGVVPIDAKVEDDSGRPAGVMEFLDGENPHQAVGHLDPTRADAGVELIRRFLDACRVVGVAHAKGYSHADCHPGNIMLLEKRQATRVVDWGSVGKVDEADRPRAHPVAPGYGDPSLGPGQPPEFTSDVFALGVGVGKLVAALARSGHKLLEGRRRASALRALGASADHAQQPAPGRRYAAAAAIAADLERLLANERVHADIRAPLANRAAPDVAAPGRRLRRPDPRGRRRRLLWAARGAKQARDQGGREQAGSPW